MSGIEQTAGTAPAAARGGGRDRFGVRPRSGPRALYAALDLGTNNCRLLIATPTRDGFRVMHGFSQIVRLGEGLSATGRLSERSMARTMAALEECAARLSAWNVRRVGCVATQACRQAENGGAFLDRVAEALGLSFKIITPEEEARLSVLGCVSLVDSDAETAMVVDIGGGSTEISLIDAAALRATDHSLHVPILDWMSAPAGVVHLAERMPEPEDGRRQAWYAEMRATMRDALAPFAARTGLAEAFERGRAHIIGTSGTVTSLAGVHLKLPRYRRASVDGLWMRHGDCVAAAAMLRDMSVAARAAHPCIGRDRADLVLPGCAILEAVLEHWPSQRLRVADRGLREGVLMTLMAEDGL